MRDETILNRFDLWNEKKKYLDSSERNLLFKEGEIWWCSMGINIGEEVYGKGKEFRRPAVILKKLSRNTCIILPTTSQKRVGSWYHHINTQNIGKWIIMMHQIRFHIS